MMDRKVNLTQRFSTLIYLAIFMLAFIPRVLALDAYVAPDEGKWIYRSAHFLQAVVAGDFALATSVAATPEVEVLAPAVPTMWTGAVGLLARYWFIAAPEAGSLQAYLAAIPPDTEKIPLAFYPWTRFPTALLTALTIVVFYYLLARLIGQQAALLAAVFLALDPFFLGLSRVIHHDALVTVFIVISLLTLLLYRQSWRAGSGSAAAWLVLSGLSGGLALLTKPTALYLAFFAALFLLFESGGVPARGRWRSIGLAGLTWGLAAGAIFMAVWPAMWSAPFETLGALWGRSVSAVADSNNYSLIPAPGTPLPELGFLFYPVNWLLKSTLPLLAGLAGLAFMAGRGRLAGAWPGAHTSAWVVKWLFLFVLFFWILLLPADTRDIRYLLPAAVMLYPLASVGILAVLERLNVKAVWGIGLLLLVQLALAAVYFPYFVDYWNPVAAGPWLAPRLVKVGSGEGLDRMGRYLSQKPRASELTVATSFWESFVPFFPGRYTKAHYDEEADYILIYVRQIQNRNPFPEYWSYFSARAPEHKVTLVGLDYAWLYPGPQLRMVRSGEFDQGLAVRGYRLDRPAVQPGQMAELTLVWSGVTPQLAARPVAVRLVDGRQQVWVEGDGPLLDPAGPSAVEGHYRLEIPPDMPRADYHLWIAPALEPGSPAWQQIGTVPVRRLDKPVVQFPATVNFGDLVTFGGASLSYLPPEETGEAGGVFNVTFLWQARRDIPQSYTTFAHLVDPTGHKWGQADRIPGAGQAQWPTTQWEKGEWLVDTFRLPLAPDTPAGDYRLLAGLYQSETLERLPVVGQGAQQTVVEAAPVRVTVP